MRLNSLLLLMALGVALITIADFIAPSDCNVVKQMNQEGVAVADSGPSRNKFRVSKILDFQLYKKLFKKAYKSSFEEIVRRKYFIARAFRAWTSSIKYKFRKSTFYLAINHLSDRSPEEMDRTVNHHSHLSPSEFENVAGVNVIQSNPTVNSKLSARTKRNVAVDQDGPRDFNEEKLISTGEGIRLAPEIVEKIDEHPESNNPEYGADKTVGVSERQIQELDWRYVFINPDGNDDPDWKEKNEVSFFSGRDDPSKPDEVFVDHRKSNCMFLPRDQGECGSCYAFTTIAIAEWLHCMRTGKLVAFSEQYMVDCGAPVENAGCKGGNVYRSGNFIHNFGVELRSNYPYLDSQSQCPYDNTTDPKSMGFIRIGLEVGTLVPLRRIEEFIQYGPMYISVSMQNGLAEYGGGILSGAGCQPRKEHAVVLVGHGRQDGIEYWLIRNSYGPDWGEAGHVKLVKESDCIHERYGTFYGTSDGMQFTHSLEQNSRYDPSIVEKAQRNVEALTANT